MAQDQISTERKAVYLDKVASGGGRPKLVLNGDGMHLVEVLAGFMCTDEEIATTLGTTMDTLMNRNNKKAFSECKKRGQSRGKVSLRRTQFKLAEKSAAMAIFLGKNYLGQKDEIITGNSDEQTNNMQMIASLINNPEPDIDIEDITTGTETAGDSE